MPLFFCAAEKCVVSDQELIAVWRGSSSRARAHCATLMKRKAADQRHTPSAMRKKVVVQAVIDISVNK